MKGRAPFEPDEQGNPPPSADPVALLNFMLQARPAELQIINLAGAVRHAKTIKRSGKRVGLVLLDVPEGVVQNLKGPPAEQDLYVLFHFRRESVDEFDEAATRRIIVPGAGPRVM